MKLTNKNILQRLILSLFFVFPVLVKAETEVVPGEYVLQMKSGMVTLSQQMIEDQLNTDIKSVLPEQNIIVVRRPIIEKMNFSIEQLQSHPMVEIAEPNYIYRINRLPDDPKLNELWGIRNTGAEDSQGNVGVEGVDIGAEQAWDITTGSRDVVVAVIDTGVGYNIEDLAENMWVNEAEKNGEEGVDDDGNGVVDDIYGYNAINNSGDPMDDHGHGSHCAGTIGAKGNDGKGLVGVAWDVRIMGVKFLSASGSGSLEDAIKAIDYAVKNGANVISASWGGGGFSEVLKGAIERANAADITFVAAAGNDSNNNDESPTYPATYDVPNVISVAALTNQGRLAYFSNYGATKVHVAAPGHNILSSTPDGYRSWSGTSMATPHISGIVSLLLSQEGELKPNEIRERLVTTARPLAGLRGRTAAGGIANAFYALTNTMPPPDENDPANWEQVAYEFSTDHPYENNADISFTVSKPGASKIAIHFSKFDTETGYDKVKFYDTEGNELGEMHGSLGDTYSLAFSMDTVVVKFTSDRSISKYGFDIDGIAFK